MHRRRASIILILITSLSCRFLIPGDTFTPVTVTESPAQTEPSASTQVPPSPTAAAPAATDTPAGLNATGPYVVYGGPDGIWISNPDGGFLTKLTGLPIGPQDLRRAISPEGDRLALIVSDEAGALNLVEVQIPGGETRTITQLFDITADEIAAHPLSVRAFTAYAIRDYDNVAWQPGEGTALAFMGAMDGPTSDLYTYDTQSGEITRLTDGLSQGVFPGWSPDGKYILHYGVSWKGPFGGALVGHDHLDGIWAVRVEDGEVLTMPTPKSVSLNFVGWQDEAHYITYDGGDECAGNLRSIDVTNGKATPVIDSSFYYYVARSPENGVLLFSGSGDCANSPGEGIFLLQPGETGPRQLADKKAWEIDWMPESGVFYAYPEALFSADGSTRYDPPVYDKSFHPAVSQKGYQAWEVIENQQGRVELRTPGATDWQTVLEGSVEELIWDPVSGETLLIVLRDGSLVAASAPDFTPRKVGSLGVISQVIWLP